VCECEDGLEVARGFFVQDGAYMCTRVPGLQKALYVVLSAELTVNLLLRLTLALLEYRGGRLKHQADVVQAYLSIAIFAFNVAAVFRSLDGRLEFVADRITFFLFTSSGTCIAIEHAVSSWRAVCCVWVVR
jgi:hypothetical protein